ncbi:hypothetical protein Vadar_031090 [Vaccinium darrowii]|uniref:Uncharacterized protein n=1 Tax=Vaccinium darrowii TaxID=229202 RepID=A0ACB7X5V7_9ERIC|nr:hypothetical protein Vadar_031090 [Vaccinium darrowii]
MKLGEREGEVMDLENFVGQNEAASEVMVPKRERGSRCFRSFGGGVGRGSLMDINGGVGSEAEPCARWISVTGGSGPLFLNRTSLICRRGTQRRTIVTCEDDSAQVGVGRRRIGACGKQIVLVVVVVVVEGGPGVRV